MHGYDPLPFYSKVGFSSNSDLQISSHYWPSFLDRIWIYAETVALEAAVLCNLQALEHFPHIAFIFFVIIFILKVVFIFPKWSLYSLHFLRDNLLLGIFIVRLKYWINLVVLKFVKMEEGEIFQWKLTLFISKHVKSKVFFHAGVVTDGNGPGHCVHNSEKNK